MQTIQLDGKAYVILERERYDELTTRAKACDLPPLPEADAEGNRPAAEFLRVSLARDTIRERAELGLTQRELAKLAGIRVETLCRLEAAKHVPSVVTMEKIDRALKRVRHERQGKPKTRKGR
jgi:DNA-binding XRE family transcriptional regulator